MIQKSLNFFVKLFLLLLPFQTVWIYNEIFLNGVKSQWGMSGFYFTEILLWIIVVLYLRWIKRQTKPGNFAMTRDRIFFASVLLFIAYINISIFWSAEKDIAWQQAIHILEMFIIFIIMLSGPWKFKDLVPWFVGGAVISSCIGIGQFFTQSTFSSTVFGMSMYLPDVSGVSVVASDTIGRWLRAYGTFVHPNILGGYNVVALIVWTLYMAREGRVKSGEGRIIGVFVLFILLLGLLFSFSRSALLAYVLFLISYFLFSLYRKHWCAIKYAAVSAVFLTTMSVIVWPLLSVRLGVTSVHEVRSVVERSQLMHSAWDIAQEQIWLGGGIGNYVFSLYRYDPTLSGWAYQPVHNVFFLLLVEVGIVGLVLITLSIITMLLWLHSVFRERRHLWFFIFVGALIYGTIGFFDHYFVSLYSGLMLSGVFWGLLLLYMRGKVEQ